MCYLKLEQDNGILKHFPSSNGVLDYVKQLVEIKNLKKDAQLKSDIMKKDFIDPTAFLVWFIENYPKSESIMKEDPNYQYRFQ